MQLLGNKTAGGKTSSKKKDRSHADVTERLKVIDSDSSPLVNY